MKRTVVLTLILVVLLLGAFSSSVGARDAVQTRPRDEFLALLSNAERPGSGFEIYSNSHKYMWKEVYVMGKVEHSVGEDDEFRVVFARTWKGNSHRTLQGTFGEDFKYDTYSDVHIEGLTIRGDVMILLEAGVPMPYDEFELVGEVCKLQKFHVRYPRLNRVGGAGFPVICVPNDGKLRIRELPVEILDMDARR